MKSYVVRYFDGKILVIRRRPRMGEPLLWSGYATDSKTALQAALDCPQAE
jgi:hypothetical protein